MNKKIKAVLSVFLSAAVCCPLEALEIPKNAGLAVLGMPDKTKVEAELALTPQAQARGLMFRKSLSDNRGMLFVFKDGGVKTFWMKNTWISLDIIFLDEQMKVRSIYHRVPSSRQGQPDSEVAKVSAPAFYVLELAAGRARKCGLKPDSRIEVSFVPAEMTDPSVPKRGIAAGKKKT